LRKIPAAGIAVAGLSPEHHRSGTPRPPPAATTSHPARYGGNSRSVVSDVLAHPPTPVASDRASPSQIPAHELLPARHPDDAVPAPDRCCASRTRLLPCRSGCRRSATADPDPATQTRCAVQDGGSPPASTPV